ncbi:MAG: tetratricopeptide repeat protein [Planctomycetia bacterium]|nr:tetratricopeptide repeat protein [Planctomycetia bacterium]
MVMHRQAGRWLLVVALTTAPNVGCKSGFSFPVWNPFSKPTPSGPILQRESDGGYIQPPSPSVAPPEPRAEEFGWTAPFRKFGETISSPFKKSATNKPAKPVVAEDDPVSLVSKQAPAGATLYISLAKLQHKAGNTESAIEQYQKALEVEPKNLQALLGLAHLYDNVGDYPNAIKSYKAAVKAHEDSAAAFNDLGLCYARSKNLPESITALKRAVELDETKALYRNNLAKVYVESDRAPEAYKILVGAHGEAVAHYNVGYMLNDRGQKTQALEHFKTAAKLDPKLKPAQQWVELLSKGESQSRTVVVPPPAAPVVVPSLVPSLAPNIAPVVGSTAAAPSVEPAAGPVVAPVAGPRYTQVSLPTDESPVAPPAANVPPALPLIVLPPEASAEVTPSGAASVIAAARAVGSPSPGAAPEIAPRAAAASAGPIGPFISTPPVATSPKAETDPSLNTPIPSPIIVPGRAEPRLSVDSRPRYSTEMPSANGAGAGPIKLPPAAQDAPSPTTTPLPAPAADEEGPRLGKKQRPTDTNVVGDRYATGSRYSTGNPVVAARPPVPAAPMTAPIPPSQGAVPPLPEQFSKATNQGPVAKSGAAPSAEPTARPATAARYPASRY